MPPAETGTYLDELPDEMRPQAPPAWEDVAEEYTKKYPLLDPEAMRKRYEQSRKLTIAKRSIPASEEDTISFVGRRSAPFLSTAVNVQHAREYAAARQRYAEGNASDDDYRTIALHEHIQGQDEQQNKTWGGALGSAAAHLPAMAGEFYAGGTLLKGGAALAPRALGWLAPAAAETTAATAPRLLSLAGFREAAKAGGKELASTLTPAGAGRVAAVTALAPSMYAERWAQNNIQAGRDPLALSKEGLSAYGLALAQTATLGAIGKATGVYFPGPSLGAAAQRVGLQAATGPIAQAATDVVGYALGLDTGYGTIEEIVKGQAGDALKHAVVQALTFAAFGLSHEIGRGKPGPQALSQATGQPVREPAVDTLQAHLQEAARNRLSPAQAAQTISAGHDAMLRMLQGEPEAPPGPGMPQGGQQPASPTAPQGQPGAEANLSALEQAARRSGYRIEGIQEKVLKQVQDGKNVADLYPAGSAADRYARAFAETLPDSTPTALKTEPAGPQEPDEAVRDRLKSLPHEQKMAALAAWQKLVQGGMKEEAATRRIAEKFAPASPEPAPNGQSSAVPQTARQKADALEREHLAALRRLQDAQRSERALKQAVGMGLAKQHELATAQKERLEAQQALDRLERSLDAQRTAAAAEDAASRPSSGPPAPELGTGLINPVQTGVPGIVSGAVEVPPSGSLPEFVRQKIDQMRRSGHSLKAVEDLYGSDTAQDQAAREYARQAFGKGQAPQTSEGQPVSPAEPPGQLSAGAKKILADPAKQNQLNGWAQRVADGADIKTVLGFYKKGGDMWQAVEARAKELAAPPDERSLYERLQEAERGLPGKNPQGPNWMAQNLARRKAEGQRFGPYENPDAEGSGTVSPVTVEPRTAPPGTVTPPTESGDSVTPAAEPSIQGPAAPGAPSPLSPAAKPYQRPYEVESRLRQAQAIAKRQGLNSRLIQQQLEAVEALHPDKALDWIKQRIDELRDPENRAAKVNGFKDQAAEHMGTAERLMRDHAIPQAMQAEWLDDYNGLLKSDPEQAHAYARILADALAQPRVQHSAKVMNEPQLRKVFEDVLSETAQRLALQAPSLRPAVGSGVQASPGSAATAAPLTPGQAPGSRGEAAGDLVSRFRDLEAKLPPARAGMVPLEDMLEASGLPKQAFDAEMLRLRRERKLRLVAAGDLSQLTERQRAAAIQGDRELFTSVERGTSYEEQTAGNLVGHPTQIMLPNGGGVPARYEVRELDTVHASHEVQPNGALRARRADEYPAGLQPRDYSGSGEQEKVDRIGKDLAPAILVTNHPAATEGPPTITPDGTVLNGNGRKMGLERAASMGKFQAYKTELVRQAANFGLDPAAVKKMKRPVLVRVVDMDPRSEQARQFAAAGNISLTQGQSPVRTAASLSRMIDADLIDSLRLEGDTTFSEAVTDPQKGKPFRQRLQESLPPQEVSRFFHEDGRLTEAGVELTRNMLLAKILPVQLIERMGEEMKGVKRTIEGSIPQLLQVMRDFPAANLSPQLVEALNVWARNDRMRTVGDADNILAQGSLFGGKAEELSPGGRMLLDFLLQDGQKPLVFRRKLSALVNDLTGSNGLFGQEYPDVTTMAADALGVAPRQGAMFGDVQAAEKELQNAQDQARRNGHSPEAIAESVQRGQDAAQAEAGLQEQSQPITDPTIAGQRGPGGPGVEFLRGAGGRGPGQPAAGAGQRGPGPAAGGGQRGLIDPFTIVATIRHLFGLPVYVEGQLQANAQALYRRKPEAAEVNKMFAGDAPAYVHELAHHLTKTQALNLDPASLPRDVVQGFRQFDYEPNRPDLRTAVREGFAEWLRIRETDPGDGSTAQRFTLEQRAADAYAENLIRRRPELQEKLDRIRNLFRQFGQQSAGEQFAGQISPTGRPAQAQVHPGEALGDYLRRTAQTTVDNLLDDAMPARRAERAAEARGEKFAPGTRLSEVIATTRLRNVPDANEMEQGGVFAYDAQGRHTRLSQPLQEAIKGLSAEEAAPGGDLDRYMHALRILHDVSTDAVKRSPDQVQGARALIAELMQGDPQKFRRLETAAQNVTNLFNATLDAMVLSGRITADRAANLKALHPFYVSEQHITEPDFRSVPPYGGRRKGEEPRTAQFLKRRTGSGEQMTNWLEALRDRFRFTASMNNDQAKFRAILDLSQREGVGQWLNPGEPGAGPEEPPIGWPRDGSKPSIVGYVEGEPIRIRVNDRPFYEMVTGTQGEAGIVQPFFKALGDVLQWTRIPQMVRTGGTIFAPLWHLKNFFRDPILYTQRTIAEGNAFQNLADLGKWYGKSFSFYWRALKAGGAEKVAVKQASDVYFQLMERMTGRELSYGAESGQQTFASRVMDGWHGLLQRVSDFLTAGEKGTRVLELKNVWDKLGWTQERIAAELAKDPAQRNPVPFAVQVAALDIASQITHNVHQQGVWVRQLNRSWPFLGAHIAGVYKDIATFATQPKKAAAGLAILAAVKGLEWLLNKDDDEYKEMPAYLRDGFVFKTPLGWLHFPAPRGIDAPITGIIGETLRATSASNPRFGDLLGHSLEGLGPHGGPEPFTTAWHVGTNRSWTGRPIIPDREADRMGIGERFVDPRMLKYQASQLTGGMLDPQRLSLNPFSMGQHPHQSVNDYWDALHTLEARRLAAPERRQGRIFSQEKEYQRLHAVEQRMRALSMELRGDRKVGSRTVQGQPPSEERQAAIRREQVRLARQALGLSR